MPTVSAPTRRAPQRSLIGAAPLVLWSRLRRLVRFQKELAQAMQSAWMFSTSEDIRYPGAEGGAVTRRMRFMHWYVDRALELSIGDEAVRRSFLEVLHMTKGPLELFRPGILARVLAGRKSSVRAEDTPQHPAGAVAAHQ